MASYSYIPLNTNTEAPKAGILDDLRARCSSILSFVQNFLCNNAGILLVTASQLFFALVNVAVKTLNGIDPPVDTLQLILVRMAITYICSMGYMFLRGVEDPWLGPKGVRLLLWFRGFSGFFGLFGVYFSLKYLSLSDATVLTFLAPFFTGITAAIFLKEPYSYKQTLAGLSSLFGVMLIARPTFVFGELAKETDLNVGDVVLSPGEGVEVTPEQRLMAVGVALIGVLGATGAYTTVRAIGTRAHALHSLASFSAQSVFVASIGMIIKRVPFVWPTKIVWGLLLAEIGIFGFCAQVLLTTGLQRESAGRGVMAIYTQIIFATLFERIFFHTAPSALSVVGTLIIIASALYVAFMKRPNAPVHEEDISLEEGLLHAQVAKASANGIDRHGSYDGDSKLESDDLSDDEESGGPSTPTSPTDLR